MNPLGVADMHRGPLSVHLIKPPEVMDYLKPAPESVMVEAIALKPHHYAKGWLPETVDDVYTIYCPPQGREYEEWEIAIMREACRSRGIRFQLHPPPVTVKSV
jgi:hypothetical protein